MNYTGKKHINYIWIPKAKSDLKEYRDILRLCSILESKNGFFNDKMLGLAQVEKGAIFDGSLDPKDYVKKYKAKSIGNQSFVSNARMSIRIARFFGWITRIADQKAKYILTDRGTLLSKFIGKFPGHIGDIDEFVLMLNDVVGMRFYCVNDHPQYQNKSFKQRLMINMLRFLDRYECLHNYELVISAFTLKNEEDKDFHKADDRLERLKTGQITISKALRECGIDPNDNSSLTGVYDGPKVLCSFLKQLNLLEPVNLSSFDSETIKNYEKTYRGSLIRDIPRNVFKITEEGKAILLLAGNKMPIWYEGLPLPREKHAAAMVLLLNNSLEAKTLDRWGISNDFVSFLRELKLIEGKNIKSFDKNKVDFMFYRDIPPENYDEVKKFILQEAPEIFKQIIEDKDELFLPKKLTSINYCIKCHPPRCSIYKELREVPNSLDYLAYKVCPNDSISRDHKSGNMIIDKKKCVSCLLCAMNCSVGAIRVKGFNLSANTVPSKTDSEFNTVEESITNLENITDQIIAKMPPRKLMGIDRSAIINAFEKKIRKVEQNWSQDEFYVWVRNCLRALRLDVKYTGGKGMKTRSDVTICSPFLAAIEVKSPSEGKVTGKAIRQTDDAAAQLFQKYGKEVYMGAVGQEISPEAIRKANEHKKYRESCGVKKFCIPLIASKALLFLVLLDQEIKFKPQELEMIFKEYHGEFGKEKIIAFLTEINKKRKLVKIEVYIKESHKIFS